MRILVKSELSYLNNHLYEKIWDKLSIDTKTKAIETENKNIM